MDDRDLHCFRTRTCMAIVSKCQIEGRETHLWRHNLLLDTEHPHEVDSNEEKIAQQTKSSLNRVTRRKTQDLSKPARREVS